MNYYNDIDARMCAWTRELIVSGHIPEGEVDCKSITEVTPEHLKNYEQCHFFNGIAGWAHALKLAGWPAIRPVWCASLPCQPFSCAGQQQGVPPARYRSSVESADGVGVAQGDTNSEGSQRHWESEKFNDAQKWKSAKRHYSKAGFWDDFEIVPCGDEKSRRIESGTFPLAHGVPGRVGLLRGYGNAIVPEVAAQFIKAAAESIKE